MAQGLKRLEGWRSRLTAEYDRQNRMALEWGKQDCVVGLGAGVVFAITGVDLAASWRGRYSNERSAARTLRDAGFKSLGEAVGQYLPEIHPDMADVGDIALIEHHGVLGEALAVFDSSGLIAMGENGHVRISRESALKAYKVGLC